MMKDSEYICHQCAAAFDRTPAQVKNKRKLCGACKAAYARKWRKGNKKAMADERARWSRRTTDPVEREKIAARKAVHHAVKRGDLVAQPCETCGASGAEAHHDDYSKPLDVRWLCKPHHHQLHLQEAA